MGTLDSSSAALTDADRGRMEHWLAEFEVGWRPNRFSKFVGRMSSLQGSLRRIVLQEMVGIDLEHHWRRGNRRILDEYLILLPELGDRETVSVELIFAEYEARRCNGDAAARDDLLRRYPAQAESLLALIDEELSPARASHSARAEAGEAGSRSPGTLAPPSRPYPEDAAKGEAGPSASRQTIRVNEAVDTVSPAGAADGESAGTGSCAAGDEIPQQFGWYRVVRKLGEGGMGTVYLAEDTKLQRLVALKIPRFSDDEQAQTRKRFLREARAAAALSHPNLCPVYNVGQIQGICYLTMEYIEGRPLADFIRSEKLPTAAQAAAIVRKMALALEEAHQRGVIHRDLKPSNVVMKRRRDPIIMDFGLARRTAQTDSRLTQSGVVLGTPAYMSPEQVRGENESLDARCDIYSLGVIFYELLTGTIPFQGAVTHVLAQIATTEPEKPSQRRPGLDPALEAICLRMMAKRSEDRYASMAEVAEELSAYLRSDRRADDPPPPAPPREPWEDGAAATDIVSALLKGRGLTRLLQPARRLGPPRSLLKVLIGLAALLPLMAGVVVLISQRHGTARIELSDPAADVQITIDDESFEISDAGRKHRFTIGPHQMTVSGENYETVTQDFTIKRGDNEPVRVTLVPAAAAEDSVAEPAQSSAAAPRTVVANSIGMELVRIPSGSFLMGSPHSDPLGEAPERPQHRVVLSRAFEMGRHEVTVGQFGQFVAATGYKTNVERDPRKGSLVGLAGGKDWEINQHQTWRDPGFPQNDDHPVVLVSWDDAVEFCRWLSLKEGKTYRLPTEAEWEYACRGGTSTVYWTGQEPQSLKGAANVADAAFREAFPAAVWSQGWNDGFATTAPVGSFRPNPFGLYDMHGNVYEFCADFYDARLYTQRSSATDPQGPDSGKFRVVRGDSFASRPASMRSAARGYADPKFAWNNTGFRVVREVETADADLATEGEQGFRPLFNGRDLTGWMVDGVNPDAWQVDSGEIVVNGDGWRTMGFLFTQRDYSDFIFRFEFQIDERSITGVGIRAVPGEHKHFDGGSAPWTLMVGMGGSLWFNMDGETHRKPDRPAKLKKQPGEWNEMEIDLRGSHLRVTINGEQVLDCQLEEFTRTSGAVPALQRSSGRIGLEKHTGTARFRNIRIRDLAAEAAAAIDSPASPPASASAIPTDAAGDRASSATADGTTSSVADSNDAQPATGLRRFGFSWAGRASEIARAAEYTNLLLLEGWEQAGGEAELTAAGEAGLPVVLVFRDAAGALERISSLFGEHPETILGACWFSPYYRGRTPQEVEEFGTRLKAKHPELQYWGAFVEKPQGRYQIDPVPAVVDVIVVNQFYDKTPQEVLAKANDTLPGWIRKANGRPVIMQWYGSDGMGKGTISKFEPGMLRTYVDVARQFKVAGVLFSRYGDFPSQRAESLHENAQIMREIRELGEKGRFGVAQEPDEASTDGTGRRIEPGFQSLFNGKDLDGWEGSIRGFYVEDDVLVSRKGMTERIYTRNQYANFHLRFDFLLAPGAVSGIGLRCGRDADPTYYGMAIQIMDETAPQHTNAKPWQAHGSIFGVVPARPGFLKPVGEWNSQEIIANGTRIVVKVNGATVINTDLRRAARLKPADGKNHPGLLNKAGRIALLGVFGDGGEVRFRNIRIREL